MGKEALMKLLPTGPNSLQRRNDSMSLCGRNTRADVYLLVGMWWVGRGGELGGRGGRLLPAVTDTIEEEAYASRGTHRWY